MKEFHRHRISLLHDAQMDMIDGLNKLTDRECPDPEDLCELSKAIKDLQKTICMIEELEDKEEDEMEEDMEEKMMARMACNGNGAAMHSAHMNAAKSTQP